MIRTLEERVVYRNRFVTVFDDLVEFEDGSTGSYFRTRWNSPFGVAVVPLIGDDVLLVRLFRYAERAWSLEIPQGFGNEGGDPLTDARRELREETGLEAATLEPLIELGQDYVTHAFLARIEGGAEPHRGGLELSESVREFVRLPVARISGPELMALGIRDSNTLACLFAARERLKR